MLWYYAADGQQLGPVSDAALDALLREGKINNATLIWREGMPDWQPLAMARPTTTPPPPPFSSGLTGSRCVECGQIFPPNQLISVNKSLVCAACKPVFLQRVAEGGTLPSSSGLWRQGKKIVTVSDTIFPDRCVKCNGPAHGFQLKRVLYWQHPAYYLLLLCNLLVLLIVVLIVRKKAVVYIGLCEAHRKQRKVAIAVCTIGLLGGVVVMCAAAGMSSGWLALAGLAVFITGGVWGVVKGRTIAATKIDKENVWVSGAGKDFLDQLPERPS
jgi:hypothetical protein